MDVLLCTLLLLTACHCHPPTASNSVTLRMQTETTHLPVSSTTPGIPTTAASVSVTSQTTPPARNETTATSAATATEGASSPATPSTGIRGGRLLTKKPPSVPGTRLTTATATATVTATTTTAAAAAAAAGNASRAGPTSPAVLSPTRTTTSQPPPLLTSRITTATPVPATTTKPSTASGNSSTHPSATEATVSPTQSTGNSLTMLAFGVMSFILVLIIVMVILVTAVNLRGRCNSSSREEGKKTGDSMVSESNVTMNGEKDSITLVSMKSINTETDTDSPQVSSVHSTILDNEEQELRRDLLNPTHPAHPKMV